MGIDLLKNRKIPIFFQIIKILIFLFVCYYSTLSSCHLYCEDALDVLNLIQKISNEEKKKLEIFFKILIIDHGFGYTLFGEKPVTFQVFSENYMLDDTFSFLLLEEGWKVWTKYRHLFPSRHFILEYIALNVGATKQKALFLINLKKSQLHCREMHHLSLDFTAQNISEKIAQLIKDALFLPEKHVTLGILLGYGKHNALRFARHQEIASYFIQLPSFPQAIAAAFDRVDAGIKEQIFYQQSKEIPIPIKRKKVACAGHDVMIDEYCALRRAWKSFSQIYPDGPMTLIRMPTFIADERFLETQLLYQSYAKTRNHLMDILQKPNFLEIILERHCNGT